MSDTPVRNYCASCGVVFYLSADHENALRRSGNSFQCPNGHTLSFKPTPDQRRIQELERKVVDLESRLRTAQTQRCPIAGCAWFGYSPASFSKHLRREHCAVDEPPRKQLPAPQRVSARLLPAGGES